MGVTGLFKFLKDRFGDDIYEYVHASHYSYKVIYFDISTHIFSYIKIYGNADNRWLNGFVKLFTLFKQYKIHLIPVFDGKAPSEKKEEREDRKSQIEKSDQKCMNISMDLETYKNTGKVSELLKDTMAHIKKSEKRLLPHASNDSSEIHIDIDQVQEYIDKREISLTDITKTDIEDLKDLLSNFGIPYLQAIDEAETLCSDLVRRGLGFATYSLDSDCVAYDVSFIINDFDSNIHVFRVIDMKKLLNLIHLTHAQLRDLCILCGVDYNRHTKPKSGVGPVSAYKLLKEYETFGNIMKAKNIEPDGYRHERCIELFSLTYPEHLDIYVWKEIQPENLISYLTEKKLFCDISKIKQYWKPLQLQFEE